jgi:HPt (histidine-containing phosphotransfer) domain-containing protein
MFIRGEKPFSDCSRLQKLTNSPSMSKVPPPNSAIAELAEALGDDSARELVDMFLNNFQNVIKELNSGDREQRRRAAHSLKSSSHIVGASGLSSRMAALEARLAEPSGAVTHDDLTGTMEEFEKMSPPLRAYSRQK